METGQESNIMCSKLDQLKAKLKVHETLHAFTNVLDDEFIAGFLRGKKDDVDKAVACLAHYIKMRTVKRKDFTKMYRPSTVNFLDRGAFNVLNGTDHQGRVVVLVQINKWIPSENPFHECMAALLFICDEGIRSWLANSNEVIAVFDCSGLCLAQARVWTPSNMLLLLDMVIKNVPSRPKGFHFINHNFLLGQLFFVMKPLLEKKIRERVHFHHSLEKLHALIPSNILPVSLGGPLSIEEARCPNFLARVKGNDEFYEKLLKQ